MFLELDLLEWLFVVLAVKLFIKNQLIQEKRQRESNEPYKSPICLTIRNILSWIRIFVPTHAS